MSEVRIRDTIRLYWNMTKGFHWPFVVVVLVIIIATSIGSLTLPWFYKLFFDTIVAGSVGDPETAQRLLRIILWIGLLGTVQWLVWRSSGFFSAWMYPKVEGILRDQTFTYLIRHSYRFFGNQFIGSLVRKVNRFVDAFPRIWEKIQWGNLSMTQGARRRIR
ncbi:MAG: Multidrug resistance ABC transporter ATP-binding protein (Fused permease/ATPase domain) [Parcubacteria group bacterium GW2011_GWA2_56_7]|nr:MAG: Multidrug resistance ABC transporter ATP-binding protein (Fused permease/ATPase domain) [Parcubacteria group bacterium GW2011_GWA2_56_7]